MLKILIKPHFLIVVGDSEDEEEQRVTQNSNSQAQAPVQPPQAVRYEPGFKLVNAQKSLKNWATGIWILGIILIAFGVISVLSALLALADLEDYEYDFQEYDVASKGLKLKRRPLAIIFFSACLRGNCFLVLGYFWYNIKKNPSRKKTFDLVKIGALVMLAEFLLLGVHILVSSIAYENAFEDWSLRKVKHEKEQFGAIIYLTLMFSFLMACWFMWWWTGLILSLTYKLHSVAKEYEIIVQIPEWYQEVKVDHNVQNVQNISQPQFESPQFASSQFQSFARQQRSEVNQQQPFAYPQRNANLPQQPIVYQPQFAGNQQQNVGYQQVPMGYQPQNYVYPPQMVGFQPQQVQPQQVFMHPQANMQHQVATPVREEGAKKDAIEMSESSDS